VVATVTTRRAALAALFVTTTLALAACGGGSPSTLHPAGSSADKIAGTWWLMFGLAIVVYVAVASFIVIAIVRGRGGGPRTSRISEHAFVWVGGIIVPAIILAVLGVVTVTTGRALRAPARSPLVVDVAAKDWWWAAVYPGQGIVTANEIHLPVGQPIEVRLTSDNVIHSFWVPQLAGKVDTIPGQVNVLRFTVDHAGTYLGLCAEFCGLQHANMHFQVVAQSAGDYARWAVQQARPTADPTSELQAEGELIFVRASCAGCHRIRGTPAIGTVGPDLTHLASRSTIGAVTVENTASNLERWVRNAGSIKPGVQMPPTYLSPDDLRAVLAYLESRS
jgi:cytochrome c oxidase subunit 2